MEKKNGNGNHNHPRSAPSVSETDKFRQPNYNHPVGKAMVEKKITTAELAKKVKISPAYLRLILLRWKMAGAGLAKKLADATGADEDSIRKVKLRESQHSFVPANKKVFTQTKSKNKNRKKVKAKNHNRQKKTSVNAAAVSE